MPIYNISLAIDVREPKPENIQRAEEIARRLRALGYSTESWLTWIRTDAPEHIFKELLRT